MRRKMPFKQCFKLNKCLKMREDYFEEEDDDEEWSSWFSENEKMDEEDGMSDNVEDCCGLSSGLAQPGVEATFCSSGEEEKGGARGR
jgi:hypothetical protein